jgi:nitronate monooxygenase
MSSTQSDLPVPLVLAPLAGGPFTPQLAAAVCEAGGLGFLASGCLTAGESAGLIAQLRELTDRPFGVNLFAPGSASDRASTPAMWPRSTPTLLHWGVVERIVEEAGSLLEPLRAGSAG